VNLPHGILRGSFSLTLVRIASSGCAFLLFWFVARSSAGDLGAFRTIFVFFLLTEFLPLLGMNQFLIREVSLNTARVRHYLLHGGLFAMAVSVLVMLGLAGLALRGGYSHVISSGLLLISAAMPATAIVLCCQSILVGQGLAATMGLLQGAETLLRTTGGIAVLLAGGTVIEVAAVMTAARWLMLWPCWRALAGLMRPDEPWRLESAFVREFMGQTPLFAAIMCLYLVIRYAAQIMLPRISGDSAAGYFAVGYQILDIAVLLPTAFAITLMPLFARTARLSMPALADTCGHAVRAILFVTAPCCMLIFFAAGPLIGLIFGARYAPSVPVLRTIIWACAIMAVDQVMSTALIAAGRQRIDLLTLAAGSAGMAAALGLLIPRGAELGAAQGLLAGMLLVIAVRWALSARVMPGLTLVRAAAPPAAAAACMALAFYAARDLYWIAQCLIGAAVYGACCAVMILRMPGMVAGLRQLLISTDAKDARHDISPDSLSY
jgi:O-antigen/teichoic acid export membrane protein